MSFAVEKVSSIDVNTIRKVLTSTQISDVEKLDFVKKNSTAIKSTLNLSPNAIEYAMLMKNRPLQSFKPVKNSFTKRGDKILLAKTLHITPAEVDDYINKVSVAMKGVNKLGFLEESQLSAVKTYVYRHGSIDNLVQFLDFELSKAKNKINVIYSNLEHHSGGIADYFIRPIHRMSNKTLINLYQVFDKNLLAAQKSGDISAEKSMKISEYAIKRLYEIQNNSKFINAIKAYKVLSQ